MSLALSSKQGVSFADIQTATTVAVYLGDFVDFIGRFPRQTERSGERLCQKQPAENKQRRKSR